MLLEIAIGDAYGAGFEYADETPDRPNDMSRYIRHPRHHGPRLPVGSYTDDCQMSLAVAEALLSCGQASSKDFIDHFVSCFKRDERTGYARGFQAFLEKVEDGDDFERRIRPNSEKSGAAMRACPIGLFGDPGTVKKMAERQARTTHATPGGIHSAQAVALAVHYLRWGIGPRSRLARYVSGYVPGPWEHPWTGEVGSMGMDSTRAAITCVMGEASLASLLKRCVDLTGDVDTVAAIALGMASCAEDTIHDLPPVLFSGLESGTYGREYLIGLDVRLEGFALANGAPRRRPGDRVVLETFPPS